MMPKYNAYGGWPASGEIDLMESRGNGPDYKAGGYDKFGSTLHWGTSTESNQYFQTHKTAKLDPNLADGRGFHIFSLVFPVF